VVACVRLLVGVEQLIAWGDNKCCTELGGPTADVVLPIASDQRSRTRQPCVRPQRGLGSQPVQYNGIGCLPVLIEEHRERHGLVFDECCCVTSTTRSDRCHP